MNKVFTILEKTLDTLLLLLCVLILLISGYSLLDNLTLYRGAEDATLQRYRPHLDAPLSAQRTPGETGDAALDEARADSVVLDGQVAWLYLYDTDIDYPLMQGADNFEYLNKDPYGEFKLSGSIFLDYRNDPDFLDEYSVIYGHHMEHGVMFGSLDSYLAQSYFDAHRSGRLVTGDAVYELELYAVCSADGTDPTLFTPLGRTASGVNAYIKDKSVIYTEPREGCRIVALTTCYGDTLMSRLLVFGTITEL